MKQNKIKPTKNSCGDRKQIKDCLEPKEYKKTF